MITIIVPIYNAQAYLAACVASLCGQQTDEALQFVLVDDGSTDSSLHIARSLARNDRRIEVYSIPHAGQSAARNEGLRHAQGEYIAFVDADDWIAPDWCSRHLSAIDGVDYVQSGYQSKMPRYRWQFTSPCMRLYRRRAIEGMQFEEGMIYEDVLWSVDLWMRGATCRCIQYAGYYYTPNPNSTTSKPHPEAQRAVFKALRQRLTTRHRQPKGAIILTIIRLKIHFMKHTYLAFGSWLLALSWLLAQNTSAATYYASPDGTGNGSSYTQPTSFNAGIDKLKNPGDTLYLLGGSYYFTDKYSINKQGSSSKRIVIAGYPGEKAVLDFRKVPYGTRGVSVHANSVYVHIKDLSIAYSGKNNLYNEGSYCLFEHLDIYGSADTGCQMKRGGNNTILNVDSHDNFDYETMSGTQANFGGNADGFADKQFTGDGNHYIGCRAWNNSDDGWDFFQRVSTTQTVVENCVCYHNGPAYYNMKNHPRYATDKAWFDSKTGTKMTDRYGNSITVTLEQYPCQGNGNGFKMGGQYTDHRILIHHCLSVANNAKGFDQNNNGGTMWVYNNSAYANTINYGFTTAYGTNSIQNNVSLGGVSSDQPKSQTVAANDHNTWNTGGCKASDFRSLDTTQILAARNADGSLPQGTFMRPASGSALIDAGVDVSLAYNGAAPDLGCYETDGEHHEPQPEDTIPTVQPEGTHRVAFVTIPGSSEDKELLTYLRRNASLFIVETDALDNTVDYSEYEAIVLGSKPNSSAAGYTSLKGYSKPMVLLKPFLLKNTAWDWGTPVNTSDVAISISDSSHPIFRGVDITDGSIAMFSQCNTNAVTAVSSWSFDSAGSSIKALGSPVSQPEYTAVAELPAGTNCNGTVLGERMVMIGVSEYSTAYLTDTGKQVIENAILYLLGIEKGKPDALEITPTDEPAIRKVLYRGQIYILRGGRMYTLQGQESAR